MVDPGTVAVRVASSAVAPLVRKLFAQPGSGAALTDQPVRLSALVSFRGEQRTLGLKEMRRLVVELVHRAGDRLVPEEREAVADALEVTLYALGSLDLEDVQAVHLGHEVLAARLYDQAGGLTLVRYLSQEATNVYSQLLDTACVNILHFFTQRSPFVARTLVDQSRKLHELIERTDILIERVGDQIVEDVGFEEQYTAHIAKKHSSLTIYGVDLSEKRQWPLDTAYLSLRATEEPALAHEAPTQSSEPLLNEWTQSLAQPVDRALAGHSRVLLRGAAGSGKTTLVQWLAVTAARQNELTGTLAHLIGRVPFVLPLRTLTRKNASLPVPADFLRAVASPLTGAQPAGWADRVLAAGRALLLIDGIDEVPEPERDRARSWLTDLLTAYPDNLCLVTSRPSAIRQDWLGVEQFTELTLTPMSRENITVFVHRWHAAAEADTAPVTALLDAIRTKQDLGRLATNPLMCALICALHRERRGFLPRGRKALYDAALSMLLERRDRERDMTGTGFDLDEESQTELLQRLAYWLIRNGRAEMDRSDAHAQLERLLPAMPHVAAQGRTEDILRQLLTRSGLLREPASGTIDFVHRTFQDYLGARAAVEERDFDLLLRHAHLDQWEDVLRMAVAHARPDERARLLQGLISRGETEPEHRTRLHLLAMACMEHAAKLEPRVRQVVEERAAELIPPHTYGEAKELAELGPIILELLPGPDELEDKALSGNVLRAASLVGGDAALAFMMRYLKCESAGASLGQAWAHFETDAYATQVVDRLRYRQGVPIAVHTPAELAALDRLGGHHWLDCAGDFTADQLRQHLGRHPVRILRIAANKVLDSLHFIRSLPDLREFILFDCPAIESLEPLRDLPLEGLFLSRNPMVTDFTPVESLNALTSLNLRAGAAAGDLRHVSRRAPLRVLFVPTDCSDLSVVRDFPSLVQLGLDLDVDLVEAGWRALTRLPELRTLSLNARELSAVAAYGVVLPGIENIFIDCRRSPVDGSLLAATFPGVSTLRVGGATDIDLASLNECTQLRALHFTDSVVRNGDALLPSVEVTRTPRAGRPM
ncbi:NACHT domain-containing protein [Streptomyces sp. NPDC001422]|uniref:NACHT domain-containing protein n=1 Tax=Streptomyces sp. NPDC001422 TaxID=3364575 RepID=UPI00368B7DC5